MSFALFLRGLVLVLAVFALATYLLTGSLWTTFIQTVVCAVLIQVGYFAAVLLMVWRGAGKTDAPSSETAQAAPKEQQSAAKVGRLPGTPSSHHP